MSPTLSHEEANVCPPWCTGDHELTADRRVSHRSEGVIVPGVERILSPDGGMHTPSVVEIAIGLERTGGETWVWLGADQPFRASAILSRETAERLVREMQTLLRRAR